MPGAGAIEAGKAFVRIFSDDEELTRGLKAIGARMNAVGAGVTRVGAGIAAAGAGIAGVGAAITGPMAAAVMQFTAAGDALDKMAARTGVGVEALAELGFAAEQGGTNIETVEKGFAGLSRALYDAAAGSSTAVDALGAIGLTVEELQGLAPEQQFQKVAEALAGVTDESQKGAIAQKLFGKAGRSMLPMLSNLREIRQEARDLGLVLNKSGTDNAAKLADAFNRIKRTMSGAFLQVGAAVAEPLLAALNVITRITTTVNKWISENHALVQTIGAIGVGFVAVGTIVGTLGGAIAAIGFAITGIGAALTFVSGLVATIGAPVLAITAAITAAVIGIGAGLAYVANEAGLLVPAFDFVKSIIATIGETFRQTFGGMVDAFQAGELGKAAQIAWAGVKLAALQGAQGVLSGIDYLWANAGTITGKFFDALISIVGTVFSNIPKIAYAAMRGGNALGEVLQSALAGAFTTGSLADGLDPAIEAAQAKLNELTLSVTPAPAAPEPAALTANRTELAGIANVDPAAFDPLDVNQAAIKPPAATGSGDLAELIATAQQQLFVLRQIEGAGLN